MTINRLAALAAISAMAMGAVGDLAAMPDVPWAPPKKAAAFTKAKRHNGGHKANARKAKKGRK